MTIIGICGRKRHGKDSFAERLTEQHGFTRFAFADTLREMALAINPILSWEMGRKPWRLDDHVTKWGWERAKENAEVRRLLQALGTEGGREHLGENVWVDATMAQADRELRPVVITDVRFPNEFEAIKKRGGMTVRVIRPDLPTPEVEHISEKALDKYVPDRLIINDGSLSDLHQKADDLVLEYIAIHAC